MTTHTASLVYDNSSIANFKAWGSGISAGIAAIGWVQTADTGQVNWTTIATVPSSTFVYEIWRANDALQSSAPIFIKVWYGFSTTVPRLQLSAGTSSDGAGNITGTQLTSAPWVITGLSTNQGATTFPCFFSGNTGNLYMYLWSTATNSPATPMILAIERAKNASGTDVGTYFTVATLNSVTSTTQALQQTITTSGVGLRDNGILCLSLTNGAGTGNVLGSVAAYPVFPNIGKVGNPLLGLMTVAAVDIANGATVTVTSMYGGTHTYVGALPSTGFNTPLGLRNSGGLAPGCIVLFE